MAKKPINFESVDREGVTHSQRALNEINELQHDNDALKKQLDASKTALDKAVRLNQELRKHLEDFCSQNNGGSSPLAKKSDPKDRDLEAIRKENKAFEEHIDKLHSQNKKRILEHLSNVEDPVDLNQLGRSFRGLTEEYKDAIKQYHEEKKNLIYEINDANDEYAELVKLNYRQQKKKLEMQNEIEALNNLIDNNQKHKDDIEELNRQLSTKLEKGKKELLKEIIEAEGQVKQAAKDLGTLILSSISYSSSKR